MARLPGGAIAAPAAVVYFVAALQLLFPLATAATTQPSSCTTVSSVRACASSITSVISRTASASKFCSSVLGCPEPTTTTLLGTVTTTSTKTLTESYTWEELAGWTTVTHRYDWTETSTTEVATVTATPTWTVQKFAVTTVAPKKRYDPNGGEGGLEARAVTSVCPSSLQKRACSCLYTCPGPNTKDNQKTVKVVETETAYVFSTLYVTATEDEYYPTFTTETSSVTYTTTSAVFATHTRTVKCMPSVANPSFYLSATISPLPTPLPFNNQYVRLEPDFDWYREEGALFWPKYTPLKADGSVFSLDDKGRLVSPTVYGDHFSSTDDFNTLEPFYFLTRSWVQAHSTKDRGEGFGWDYLTCELAPPSGKYPGGYKELKCHGGYWNLTVFQYCPLYETYYPFGTVVGTIWEEEAPACYIITFLVVPVCGS
ncbi:hypothetical protein B0H63DRAFT_487732 [Podospora didyma]|uniref:Uncharacterized protein n=1 Tax=Podospora didyma TaxID=330526 RepID=A0AAE0K1B6_9PEZI|nr:hypothetical protein B0H63DRAFT_487732 [Podospora didyma]